MTAPDTLPPMTMLPPLEPAEKTRFIAATVVAGVMILVAVAATSVFGSIKMAVIAATCVDPLVCYGPDATTAMLGPTILILIGPPLLFLAGGIVALVRRGRRLPGVATTMIVTVIAQVVWILAAGIILVLA